MFLRKKTKILTSLIVKKSSTKTILKNSKKIIKKTRGETQQQKKNHMGKNHMGGIL